MLIVVSPAKSLDYESKVKTSKFTKPALIDQAEPVLKKLQSMSAGQLSKLMHMSAPLGELNHERYQNWAPEFTPETARQALFAFKGDVYLGLEAEQLSAADLTFAQDHLRILSGLYGVLRPLDLMQPYRLEMGTSLKVGRKKNLYEFWGSKLTEFINADLDALAAKKEKRILVNLASHEYFNSLQPKSIEAEIITPVFKDFSSGKYRVLSFFAKKARGQMVSFIIRNRIKDPTKRKEFDIEGYQYSESESSDSKPVFLRKQKK